MKSRYSYINIELSLNNPVTVRVTTVAAIRTPMNTASNAFLKGTPNMNAAAHPDHAPVAGNGMPTNTASPQNSYLSIISPFLRVLVKSHLKNLSPQGCRDKSLDTGSSHSRRGITGIIFPRIASKKTHHHCISIPIPTGIAPLSSNMGVVLIRMTTSQEGMPYFSWRVLATLSAILGFLTVLVVSSAFRQTKVQSTRIKVIITIFLGMHLQSIHSTPPYQLGVQNGMGRSSLPLSHQAAYLLSKSPDSLYYLLE